jgi:predicted nucleic acid-binding protein
MLGQVVQQHGLARPWVAAHHQGLALTGPDRVDKAVERGAFAVAVRQRRHAAPLPEFGSHRPGSTPRPGRQAVRERSYGSPDERVLWADEPDELDAVWRAISARDDKNHKLWTDDYLAAFAQASDATLATLDTKFPTRYPSVRVESLLP